MSPAAAVVERRPLSKEVAARAALLSLRARAAADALLAGHHRSVRHGASAVFVEHREYRPGDDPRRLDWRAFARTDRPTVRHFEHEAQLRATLAFDRSSSMYFGDPPPAETPTKAEHAATLLAALAYLLLRQGDAFGLTYVDRDAELSHPPRSRPDHFDDLLGSLATNERPPERSASRATSLATALTSIAERSHRHGVVVLASDLLDPDGLATSVVPPPWCAPIALMARRGQTVLVLHTLTRTELLLPGTEPARFEGLEGEPPTDADPAVVGPRYRDRVSRFCADAERGITAAGGRYVLTRTDEAPALALARLLSSGPRGRT
ncbi:MAG: DUF58 domain-containing protein [Polyangiales bacterium]|nr:DUF58 domain-containing protein [Myxococcales bacterium]